MEHEKKNFLTERSKLSDKTQSKCPGILTNRSRWCQRLSVKWWNLKMLLIVLIFDQCHNLQCIEFWLYNRNIRMRDLYSWLSIWSRKGNRKPMDHHHSIEENVNHHLWCYFRVKHFPHIIECTIKKSIIVMINITYIWILSKFFTKNTHQFIHWISITLLRIPNLTRENSIIFNSNYNEF